MNNEMQIRKNFYNQLQHELNSYKKSLEELSSNEIMDEAYEIVMKELIVDKFYPKYENFSVDDIKLLQKYDSPLNILYEDWLGNDISDNISEVLEYSIAEALNDLSEYDKDPEDFCK